MGSMALSTFMMFVPWHVEFIFLTICCVGFFGIYIPYNESKKKGEVWAPLRWLRKITEKRPLQRSRPSGSDHITSIGPTGRHQLEQLKTLKSAGLITEQEYQQKRRDILKKL